MGSGEGGRAQEGGRGHEAARRLGLLWRPPRFGERRPEAGVREAGSSEGRPRASAACDWRQDEYAQRGDPTLSWEQ